MKKITLLTLAAFLTVSFSYSQKTVIGTVDYTYRVTGEGAAQMAGMMPNKMIIKYGKNGLSMVMQGGMMAAGMGKTIVNGETGEAFIMKDAEKVVYMMSEEEINAEAEKLEDPVIEEFDETKTILGYTCKKYKQTVKANGMEIPQIIWATKELAAPEYESKAFKGIASQGGGINFNIDGFPLLIEIAMPGAPFNIELEVTNIDFGKIPNKEFERPKDYEVKPFSEMMQFGM